MSVLLAPLAAGVVVGSTGGFSPGWARRKQIGVGLMRGKEGKSVGTGGVGQGMLQNRPWLTSTPGQGLPGQTSKGGENVISQS